MIPIFARCPRAAVLAVAVLIWPLAAVSAHAQGSVKAKYRISMTAVTIGHIAWTVDIGDRFYTTAASGKASGLLSFLVNGEGGVVARGTVENGRLVPVDFTSTIVDEDGKTELRIAFENGAAKEEITESKEPPQHRVPVAEADRRGVADPLTAVLIPGAIERGALAPANCQRVLAIFDGRRRYNLALSYLRNESVTITHGYSGPALICGVVLQPIAGYRPDSLLVKYVAGRRDMELWFAPIDGTAAMAPIRVLMPTVVGTLRIEADEFTTAALKPATATPSPTAPLDALPK